MKKSVAITAVLAFHVAAIGILMVQPGCSSEPEKPALGTAASTTEDVAQTTLPNDFNEGAPIENADNGVVMPPEGSSALRAAPTRPVWNVSQGEGDVIVPAPAADKPSDDGVVIAPATPSRTVPSEASASVYVVKKGDSLSKIANAHRVTLGELMNENGLTKDSILRVGQSIAIPAHGEAKTPVVQAQNVQGVPAGVDSQTYVVKKGDSLSKIAKAHGMSVATLKSINSLSNDNIRIGQKLSVVKSAKLATSTTAPVSAAPAANAESGEVAVKIKSGDTLGGIAVKYGSSVSAIMQRNGISDARKLRVGQVIYVSDKKGIGGEKKAEAPKAPTTEPKASGIAVQSDAENKTTQESAQPSATLSPEVNDGIPISDF